MGYRIRHLVLGVVVVFGSTLRLGVCLGFTRGKAGQPREATTAPQIWPKQAREPLAVEFSGIPLLQETPKRALTTVYGVFCLDL